MANSGTVTAGSAALASQYNNLRDDVLNVSTGHTHTGASEDGKKVEGSAIASTGATNGQVLAADGAGGAAFTTLAGAGTYGGTTVSVTFASSTATQLTYTCGTRSQWVVSGAGSVLYSVISEVSTGQRSIKEFALGATAVAASTSPALTVAGTVNFTSAAGYGFSAGTAVVVGEMVSATTTANLTGTLRKFNQGLTSNMWNATIYSNAASLNRQALAFGHNPPIYETDKGIWYSWDRMSTNATGTSSRLWIVNDSSGSVYSATFGTSSSTIASGIQFALYVPPVSSGDGTIHAWGTVDNAGTTTYQRISYAVSGTSITASATASSSDGYSGFWAGNGFAEQPYWGFWDAANTAIVVNTIGALLGASDEKYNAVVAIDRTAGTKLWRSVIQAGTVSGQYNRTVPAWDATTRFSAWAASSATMLVKWGAPGYMYAPRMALFDSQQFPAPSFYTDTSMSWLAGVGSATHLIVRNTAAGSSVVVYPINAAISETTILPATSKGRMVFADLVNSDQFYPVTITASSAYPLMANQGEVQYGASYNQRHIFAGGAFPMYLPANTSLSATFSRNQYLGENTTQTTFTTASTVSFAVRTIDLA
jgi:hypothetical protein